MNYIGSIRYDQHGRKRKTKALSAKRKVKQEFKPLKVEKTFAQQQKPLKLLITTVKNIKLLLKKFKKSENNCLHLL